MEENEEVKDETKEEVNANAENMKVGLFLVEDFEEMEAICVVDILRRGNVETHMISLTDSLQVKGSHDIVVTADKLYSDLTDEEKGKYLALVLPGGPGTDNYLNHKDALQWLCDHYNVGRLVGAICAAPALLYDLGMLKDKYATCFPTLKDHLKDSIYMENLVVLDNNVVTSRGPATSMFFGIALLQILTNEVSPDIADRVKDAILLDLFVARGQDME